MEKTLTMGAFEALDQQEMLETEGGIVGEVVIGLYFSYEIGKRVYKAGKSLYDMGYENGYNSTRK